MLGLALGWDELNLPSAESTWGQAFKEKPYVTWWHMISRASPTFSLGPRESKGNSGISVLKSKANISHVMGTFPCHALPTCLDGPTRPNILEK